MKIYNRTISSVGKTTFSKKLAKKYNTKAYELDCIVYDDKTCHIKCTDVEIENIFNKILDKSSWIIDGVSIDI